MKTSGALCLLISVPRQAVSLIWRVASEDPNGWFQPGLAFSAELEDRGETWDDLLHQEAANLAPVGTQNSISVPFEHSSPRYSE